MHSGTRLAFVCRLYTVLYIAFMTTFFSILIGMFSRLEVFEYRIFYLEWSFMACCFRYSAKSSNRLILNSDTFPQLLVAVHGSYWNGNNRNATIHALVWQTTHVTFLRTRTRFSRYLSTNIPCACTSKIDFIIYVFAHFNGILWYLWSWRIM